VLSAYLYGQRWCGGSLTSAAMCRPSPTATTQRRYPRRAPSELANLALSMRRMANAILEREAALAASEERYHALFSDAPLAYQSLDVADLRLVEVNDAWLALLGLPPRRGHRSRSAISLISDPCRSGRDLFRSSSPTVASTN
jgi:PAS domain-containing protein